MPDEYPAGVDSPHYYQSTRDIECIDVVENLSFCRGNAIKYLWRAGSKDDELQDLYKAKWYVEREIARLESRPDKDISMIDKSTHPVPE